jgi:preprotein translocase subunit SecA
VLPARFFASRTAVWEAVVAEARHSRQCGQPVLVGTRTIAESEALAARFDAAGMEYRLLNGTQDADEAAIIDRAGEPGAITLATNMAGRGTDIRLASGVAECGGLYVIGTERHESSRIDRQLIGRAARQGDPGRARFFLSAEDELVRLHAPSLAQQMQHAASAGSADGACQLDFTPQVDEVQRRVEGERYHRRRQLFQQDRIREHVLAKFAQED